jgi:hypothetical protein
LEHLVLATSVSVVAVVVTAQVLMPLATELQGLLAAAAVLVVRGLVLVDKLAKEILVLLEMVPKVAVVEVQVETHLDKLVVQD